MTVTEESTTGGRAKTKRYGVVTEMRDTEKGKVGNKTGQVLMLITTNKQDAEAPPYALQAKLLDFKGLDSDLLASYRKDLPSKPTLIQTSRKHALCVSCPGHPLCVVVVGKLKSVRRVHKAWMKENTPKDDSPATAQVMDAASAEEPEADASQEEEADEEEGDEEDEPVVSSAAGAVGEETTTDEDNDKELLLVKPVLNALKASPSSGARAAAAPAAPVRRKVPKELGQD